MSDPVEAPTADADLLVEKLRVGLKSLEIQLGLAVEHQRLLLERVQRIEKRVFTPDWVHSVKPKEPSP